MRQGFERKRNFTRRRGGLSIIELLISLALAASLLTAVAAAFSSTATAVEANDRVFRATQAARVTMLHLLTEIRNGTIDEQSPANEMHLISSSTNSLAPSERTYRFLDGKLLLVIHGDTGDEQYVLARNVAINGTTDSHFAYEVVQDANNTMVVARVAINLVVRVNEDEIRLSGTASPRRHLRY